MEVRILGDNINLKIKCKKILRMNDRFIEYVPEVNEDDLSAEGPTSIMHSAYPVKQITIVWGEHEAGFADG